MKLFLNILFLAIGLFGILGANDYFGGRNLYNEYWWLDIIMHFIGGLWVASVYYAFVKRPKFFHIVLFVFLIGIIWEILEYVFETPFFGIVPVHYTDSLWILDTLIDLIADVSAAVVLWWYNKPNV